jgi:peroxiredoxin
LADYQTWLPDLMALEVTVMAASVDDEATARKTADALKLSYALASGLDYQAVSRATGAFIEHERKILHATGFVLKPDMTVQVATYSTGPIGRLTAGDVSSVIRGARNKDETPQGERPC